MTKRGICVLLSAFSVSLSAGATELRIPALAGGKASVQLVDHASQKPILGFSGLDWATAYESLDLASEQVIDLTPSDAIATVGGLPTCYLVTVTAPGARGSRTCVQVPDAVGVQELSNLVAATVAAGLVLQFTEADPIWAASPSYGITADLISHWSAAYGWGDHAGLYDPTGSGAAAVAGHAGTYDHGLIGTAVQPGDDVAVLGSGAATPGYAPLADGAGGVTWGQVAAGESDAIALGDHEAAADPHPGYALESALGALAYEAAVQGSPSGETDPDLFASTDDAGDIEMVDAPEARARLGLGTAATTDASAYEPAGVTASEVANTPAGDVAATDVQGAINELAEEKLAPGGITTIFGFAVGWDNWELQTAEGVYQARLPMPYGLTVTNFVCSVSTAPTGGYIQIDINASATSILSTKLTIDAGEYSSLTAATPPVVSDTSLAYDEPLSLDIDAVGATTPGMGLKCHIVGLMP